MTNGIELGSYVAAAFLALGVLATLLIPATRPAGTQPPTDDQAPAEPDGDLLKV